ncbi:MAG: nitronate monooxygenase [Myxococcaceae bacterium]|nr:nitronate monooxygenase [Myxococcaceae bacterium]
MTATVPPSDVAQKSSLSPFLRNAGVRFPVFQAPMAGGPDSPALAAAVSEAGGLGSLGCAYLTPEKIEQAAAALRALTSRPFALNLFVRADPPRDAAAHSRAANELEPLRRELGLGAHPPPPRELPNVDAQLEAVLRIKPRVFTFTFGVPRREQLAALRAAGVLVMGTATSLEEGRALEAAGVDAICAQGSEAGGHRGTFIGEPERSLIGVLTLTRQLVTKLHTPIVAAGGIMDGAGLRAALELGAVAAQLGTAFMLCPEAGTHAAHRKALRSPDARHTVVTRAFSGRAARGIENRFTREVQGPAAFPHQQALTAELRAAAAEQGRVDLMQLWSGQNAALLRELPAAQLVAKLVQEAGLQGTTPGP